MATADVRLGGVLVLDLGPGYDGGPAAGRGAGGSTGPGGGPFLLDGTGSGWSKWVRDGVDALPGGGDLI